jgi:hypothetical protein
MIKAGRMASRPIVFRINSEMLSRWLCVFLIPPICMVFGRYYTQILGDEAGVALPTSQNICGLEVDKGGNPNPTDVTVFAVTGWASLDVAQQNDVAGGFATSQRQQLSIRRPIEVENPAGS